MLLLRKIAISLIKIMHAGTIIINRIMIKGIHIHQGKLVYGDEIIEMELMIKNTTNGIAKQIIINEDISDGSKAFLIIGLS